jgi:hypothetical protein
VELWHGLEHLEQEEAPEYRSEADEGPDGPGNGHGGL